MVHSLRSFSRTLFPEENRNVKADCVDVGGIEAWQLIIARDENGSWMTTTTLHPSLQCAQIIMVVPNNVATRLALRKRMLIVLTARSSAYHGLDPIDRNTRTTPATIPLRKSTPHHLILCPSTTGAYDHSTTTNRSTDPLILGTRHPALEQRGPKLLASHDRRPAPSMPIFTPFGGRSACLCSGSPPSRSARSHPWGVGILECCRPCVFPPSSTLVPTFVQACPRLRPRLFPPSSTLVPAFVHACPRLRPRLFPPSATLVPAFVQASSRLRPSRRRCSRTGRPCIPAKSGWDKLPPPNVSRPSTVKKAAKSQEKSSGASAPKSKPARQSRSQHEQRLCLFFYAPQRHDTLDPGASIDNPNPNHRCSARSTTTTPAAEKLSGSTSPPPKTKPAKEPNPSDLISLPATVAKPKLSQKAAGRGDSDTAPNVGGSSSRGTWQDLTCIIFTHPCLRAHMPVIKMRLQSPSGVSSSLPTHRTPKIHRAQRPSSHAHGSTSVQLLCYEGNRTVSVEPHRDPARSETDHLWLEPPPRRTTACPLTSRKAAHRNRNDARLSNAANPPADKHIADMPADAICPADQVRG
ncbi:hypothetical protein BJ138DRAFT_1239941 [Hygrophoropsis aurantiaca]|uniref:Uncharacterized protein n=1 Tax=Hygrophoropsis aurantiaca TaxID=72124 RepID=A0ACB7ZTS5_9AGAM|nr:hypothetical protein BJ138DRAFT_1239941 [Hygrophoropsis aurantiaca]